MIECTPVETNSRRAPGRMSGRAPSARGRTSRPSYKSKFDERARVTGPCSMGCRHECCRKALCHRHEGRQAIGRPCGAGLATVAPSKPATPGHCLAIECEEASAVTPKSTDNGERGSRLQAEYAT